MNEKLRITSGKLSPISGYFIYEGSSTIGEIPCFVSDEEKTITLNKGDEAPYIVSCHNHPAVWKLVVEKKSTPLLHIH
jgi:hypothetical protein